MRRPVRVGFMMRDVLRFVSWGKGSRGGVACGVCKLVALCLLGR